VGRAAKTTAGGRPYCRYECLQFAAIYGRTRPAYQEHEGAKADLKKLMPEDAREATGHGLRANRRGRFIDAFGVRAPTKRAAVFRRPLFTWTDQVELDEAKALLAPSAVGQKAHAHEAQNHHRPGRGFGNCS
jgi:hypothetical protein